MSRIMPWMMAIVFACFTFGCGGEEKERVGDMKILEGKGVFKWRVPKDLAGDEEPTFKRLTSEVHEIVMASPALKSLEIEISVECADIYGKHSDRVSKISITADDIEEMRKFVSSAALSEGCFEWQMAFEAGYKMCGQIE